MRLIDTQVSTTLARTASASKGLLFLLSMCVVNHAYGEAPAAPPATLVNGWVDGEMFRAVAKMTARASSYEVMIEHQGLAQPDGRDIRIVAPDGNLVSMLICHAEPTRARIVFDGAAGPGDYTVFMGNMTTAQASPPVADTWALGRKEWRPAGGYQVASVDPAEPVDQAVTDRMNSLDAVVAMYDAWNRRAAELEPREQADAKAAKRPEPRARHAEHLLSNLGSTMLAGPVQPNWYHHLKAHVVIPEAGSYSITLGDGRESNELGVVVVDGDKSKVAVTGWYNPGSIFGQVNGTIGSAIVTAGPHVFELYTNRRVPEIRIRPMASDLPPRLLGGLDAYFPDAPAVTLADFEPREGKVYEAYLAQVRKWIELGRYGVARSLSIVAKEKFAADAALQESLARESDRAEQASFDENWLMEGKNPARTGYVDLSKSTAEEQGFGPPLRLATSSVDSIASDPKHLSSAVWVEGKTVYGLPYEVQSKPWGMTSGVATADGLLYGGTKNGVMLAILLNGVKKVWEFPAGGACYGSPLIYRGKLYFGGVDRRLYALDARTGRMAWNYPTRGWITGSAAAADGNVYVGSLDGTIYAIDAKLGVERWKTDLKSQIDGTPTAYEGRVYVGDRAGEVVCLDSKGSVVWRFATAGPVRGGVCAGAGKIAFGDSAGRVYGVEATSGKLLWNAAAEVGGAVVVSPIMVGTRVWGGTDDGKLFGIDVETGKVVYNEATADKGAVTRQMAYCQGTLIVVTSKREMIVGDQSMPPVGGATMTFLAVKK